jgi:hypothetical protein
LVLAGKEIRNSTAQATEGKQVIVSISVEFGVLRYKTLVMARNVIAVAMLSVQHMKGTAMELDRGSDRARTL